MRVAFAIETLGAGGAERSLVDLALELVARGHRVEVITLSEPHHLAAELRRGKISVVDIASPVVRGSGLRARAHIVTATLALAQILRRRKPDVLHSQLLLAGLAAAGSRALAPGPARVFTFQNEDYIGFPAEGAGGRLRRFFDSLAMRRGMDRLAGVSDAVVRHYSVELGLGPLPTIPNGLPVRPPGAIARERGRVLLDGLGIASNELVVLCPGRLTAQKRHRDLISAAARLRTMGVNFRLLLAGSGDLAGEITEDARTQGIADRTHLLGRVEHHDLLALMAIVDVVTLASDYEGLPVAIMEAMVAGRAVVVTAVGGVPELVADGDSGLLVPPRQPAALAAALKRTLRDEQLRNQMGKRAREVIADYDIRGVADRYEALYRDAIAAMP